MAMIMQTIAKGLSIFGISPGMVEVMYVDHEEAVGKAKFADHMATHGIAYDSEEEYNYRLGIFTAKDKKIEEHNKKSSSFTLTHNHLSTLTSNEADKMTGDRDKCTDGSWGPGFHEGYTGDHYDISELDKLNKYKPLPPAVKFAIDWAEEGWVNDVRQQGPCGSCWAFGVATVVASRTLITSNLKQFAKTHPLSTQQMIDCAYNSYGCDGTKIEYAYFYTTQRRLNLDKYVPYIHKPNEDGNKHCPSWKDIKNQYTSWEKKHDWKIDDLCNDCPFVKWWQDVKAEYQQVADIGQIKAAIEQGPITLIINHHSTKFKHYHGGLIDECDADDNVDDKKCVRHVVIGVGYGKWKDGREFIKIQNSWGTKWGDKGYAYIALNHENLCEILYRPMFPIINNKKYIEN